MSTLATRARGLGTRQLPETGDPPAVVEDLLRARAAQELAILRRWGADAVTAFELDEDRRTLRGIARGIAARMPAAARIAGTVPTSSLPHLVAERVANAASFAEVAALLPHHPLAAAFAHSELFEIEHALAARCFAHTRGRERAFATYLAQTIDIENAIAALLLAARGGDVAPARLFLAGGRVLDRETFIAAAASADTVRERLARAFAGTPIARALFAAGPAAVEDAGLAWQLATQTRLRRLAPLGLAPVLWLVLRRREETRRLRTRAWSAVLGGPP